MDIYLCVQAHENKVVCIYMYICVCIYMYVYTYIFKIYMYIYTDMICIHMCTYIHIYIKRNIHMQIDENCNSQKKLMWFCKSQFADFFQYTYVYTYLSIYM